MNEAKKTNRPSHCSIMQRATRRVFQAMPSCTLHAGIFVLKRSSSAWSLMPRPKNTATIRIIRFERMYHIVNCKYRLWHCLVLVLIFRYAISSVIHSVRRTIWCAQLHTSLCRHGHDRTAAKLKLSTEQRTAAAGRQ